MDWVVYFFGSYLELFLSYDDDSDDDWFDYSFLDSEGDLQEKPVINGQLTAN